jgi:hypothetical protein
MPLVETKAWQKVDANGGYTLLIKITGLPSEAWAAALVMAINDLLSKNPDAR